MEVIVVKKRSEVLQVTYSIESLKLPVSETIKAIMIIAFIVSIKI
jgi:hypothetical protein